MPAAPPIKQTLELPENAILVRQLLERNPALTRTRLAEELCRQLKLRDRKGDWQIATAARALREMEAQGLVQLPAPAHAGPRSWSPRRLEQRVKPASAVPERLEAVQGLKLVEVSAPEQLRIWNELMLREHPLRTCRLVGRQLRYLIASDHGWLGGLGFGSAALYLESRDEWIGWNPAQRTEHLPRVVNMTRFLVRPGVRCPNLASHVLGLCARRIAADFERRYGLVPWLLESFVDTSAYAGTCYKAANWILAGHTKGRGRNGGRDAGQSIKEVYLYALVDDLRARVGVQPPPVKPLAPASGLDAAGWAGQEFGDCELGDERLTRRVVKIVSEQSAQPGVSYAEACHGERHALKGYYRFLNAEHDELEPASLLATHRGQTLRRMKGQDTVLLIQDSSDLNFSTRTKCEDLGVIGTNQTGAKSQGLRLHSCLAVGADDGLPLGVVRFDGYAPESAKGKDPARPIEEKDSHRWLVTYQDGIELAATLPDTRFISVADREGDIFELFDLQRRLTGKKPELLVRAKCDRRLEETEETERKLFAELAEAPLAGEVTVHVPRQREKVGKPSKPGRPGLPAREAQVEVRFKEVTIVAPQTVQTRDRAPLRLWAVYLEEKNVPAGATAVRWLLLTTVQVVSLKQAMRCVRWYCRRWRIEEWHRVLKSGCKIEEHQNHSAEALLRAITLDAVIAWRIMVLVLLGREVPGLPAEGIFDPDECEVLELLAKKKHLTLSAAIIVIAKLGGFLNRKCDGNPGYESLWKGYAQFRAMVQIVGLSRRRARGADD
jgi:hypothetical protein